MILENEKKKKTQNVLVFKIKTQARSQIHTGDEDIQKTSSWSSSRAMSQERQNTKSKTGIYVL